MYFGSVRFFKHIILAVLALLFAGLIFACITLKIQVIELKKENLELLDKSMADNTSAGVAFAELKPASSITLAETETHGSVPKTEGGNIIKDAGGDSTAGKVAPPAAAPKYQSLYPELYCDTPIRAEKAKKTVYLTFDDGPSKATDSILDTLKEYKIKATFFVVGKTDKDDIARMKRIVDEGHSIGIHTYSHVYDTIYASVENYLEDFNKIYELIYENTGVKPTIFRFPGGSKNSHNSDIYKELIAEMQRRGFTYYDWNVSGTDAFKGATAKSVANNVMKDAVRFSRGMVLLHDSYGYTAEALKNVIPRIQEEGFAFAPITNAVPPIIFSYKN